MIGYKMTKIVIEFILRFNGDYFSSIPLILFVTVKTLSKTLPNER